MNNQITLGKRAMRLALCATVMGAGLASQAAHAVVIVTAANIAVPFNVDGVYLNVVTGATAATGGANVGWDINPFFLGSTTATPNLAFLASTISDVNRGIVVTPLANGSAVGAASTFATNLQNIAALPAGIYNFGFRFTNEGNTPLVNYGYVTMQIALPLAANAVRILGWAYGNAGETLTVTAVPEPSTALLFVGGLLAAAAMRKRLQARQDA